MTTMAFKTQILQIIESFYNNVFDDVMIGYLFQKTDKETLIKRQYEFSLNLLGIADQEIPEEQYHGRPLKMVHSPLNLRHGHYNRRQQLLKEALHASSLPEEIQKLWLAKEDSFKNAILNHLTSCNAPSHK